jgi:two-component system CheB/CheR fusion protein
MSNDHSRKGPRRVLLTDDNLDALESLAMLLSLEGHTVYTASNGEQSLVHAEQHQPDVALVDISMPGMDGYEVARRIRAQPWGRSIMLVALSGYGPDSEESRFRDAGFDSHLLKPVEIDQLTRLLTQAPSRAT